MLLIPQINFKGDLSLDAYSYSRNEINAVGYILDKSRIKIVNKRLKTDSKGRYGLRYLIMAHDVVKLEQTLNLKFEGRERNTRVTFEEMYLNADGEEDGDISYKCSRIDTPPNSCETIIANDDKEASVKCALIANSNNWLGGVPTRGRC